MLYYLDTEFIDDSKTIDLISIGIVAEDGREYYAQSCEFDHRKASECVKDNVLIHLQSCLWANVTHVDPQHSYVNELNYHQGHGQCRDQQRRLIHSCPWRTREQIKHEILAFMDAEKYGKPELWGYYSSYDHVVFAQLFGTMMDLPEGYPMLTYDLRQWLDLHGMKDIHQPDDSVHNALLDARWVAETYRRLVK